MPPFPPAPCVYRDDECTIQQVPQRCGSRRSQIFRASSPVEAFQPGLLPSVIRVIQYSTGYGTPGQLVSNTTMSPKVLSRVRDGELH